MKTRALAILFLVVAPAVVQAQQVTSVPARSRAVDSVFAAFTGTHIPGCAVGVSERGTLVLARAYGMADLEHDVPNTASAIFEAGSVSKQITAAAIVLLAQDGRISLDDDVRKHIPELPDYGTPITIRHLLNHTSGLRDWGSVAGIGGWPRGSRVHTHEHVLDIARRQRALNYTPGEFYSYTNTGYNLQAILVERLSGMSFAEFSRRRIFEPLGMGNTQWRDDYTRIVKDRAVAYRRGEDGEFRLDMPFEDVHGNGGLLTTVADLLRWTAALEAGEIGGSQFVEEMHRQGRLNDGREIQYASGLVVGQHRDIPEVSHSGSTAGYRAFLSRYPAHGMAVAVLCNAAHAGATGLARSVADIYLGAPAPAAAPHAVSVPGSLLTSRAGVYRDERTGRPLVLTVENGTLRVRGGETLTPLSSTRFQLGTGSYLEFDAAPAGERAAFRRITSDGDVIRFEPVTPFTPAREQLREFAGIYESDEAESSFTVSAEGDELLLRGRFGDPVRLRPVYPDAFLGGSGMYRFIRDSAGRVTELSAVSDRVWDLRFQRVTEGSGGRHP